MKTHLNICFADLWIKFCFHFLLSKFSKLNEYCAKLEIWIQIDPLLKAAKHILLNILNLNFISNEKIKLEKVRGHHLDKRQNIICWIYA